MLKVTSMSSYKAFRWLWRFDPEAKWYWLTRFIMNHNLKEDVLINLTDFKR